MSLFGLVKFVMLILVQTTCYYYRYLLGHRDSIFLDNPYKDRSTNA